MGQVTSRHVRQKKKTEGELLREVKTLRKKASTLEACEIERNEIQSELKKNEDDVQALLNATPEIAFLMDKDGVILAANESAAHAYHKPVQNLLGVCVYDLIPPELAFFAKTKALEAVGSDDPVRFEMEWKGRFLDHSLYLVRDEKQRLTKVAVYVRDITRRKQMEAELQQAEEKYRKIYENATEGIYQSTPDGRFINVNPSFARTHGYDSPDECLRSVTDIGKQLWEDPQERLNMIDLLKKQGSVENLETRMHQKDGSLHWVSINARSVLDEQGKMLYIEGTMRDITRRKEATEALAESEERYRTAIEHSNDGVAIVGKNGRHQYVNKRFVEMFGYATPEEIIGRRVTIVVHPDDRERVSTINQRRWKGGPTPSRYEFTGITKDGRTISIEVSATRTTYRNEPVLLVYLRDITERKLAEKALLRSHEELEQLNRMKTKAVNHISHELKTPLAVIMGNVRVLRRKVETSSLGSNLNGILDALERNTERLLRMQRETDEIFRVSQEIETSVLADEMEFLRERLDQFGNVPPEVWNHWGALKEWLSQYRSGSTEHVQAIDLYPFVRIAVENAKQRAAHRKLEIQIEGKDGITISMDPRIVGEVVEGLLKNAIENTPDGGIIRVTVEETDNRVWIHVQDSGVGITEENQRYIFDGLFHTEETDLYVSKNPYDFGAGGKGLDLLRMKLYARKFGFEISMKSRRCGFIPTDKDLCPGNISLCEHCKTLQDCFHSGGTTFSVSFLADTQT
jgi:PAS domain S-box-containing protein